MLSVSQVISFQCPHDALRGTAILPLTAEAPEAQSGGATQYGPMLNVRC